MRDYVGVLGLTVIIDEAEGYAFLRSRPLEETEEADPALPRLIARRSLSLHVSLLLALLRKQLAEHDASGRDARLVLTREQIVETLRVFMWRQRNGGALRATEEWWPTGPHGRLAPRGLAGRGPRMAGRRRDAQLWLRRPTTTRPGEAIGARARPPFLGRSYPGGSIVTGSTHAEAWTKAIGIDFHEVRLAANGHELTLVFSELHVGELAPDYTPWRTST